MQQPAYGRLCGANALRLYSEPRRGSKRPLAVGFGLAVPSHVKLVIDNGADAAIVGSKFAQIVERNLNHSGQMLKELRDYVQALKMGTLPSEAASTNPK